MKRLSIYGVPWFSDVIAHSLKVSNSGGWRVDVVCGEDWFRLGKFTRFARTLRSILSCDVLLINFIDSGVIKYMRLARVLGKKVVAYWIGTDVYAQQLCKDGSIVDEVARYADTCLSYGESLHDELLDLGLESGVLVIPSEMDTRESRMPNRHVVLLSIAEGREEFYNYDSMMRLVRENPDIRFLVIRNNRRELFNEENIEFRGVVPRSQMEDIYDSVSIVVRWPEHDSESVVSMEALIKGKRVISRFPFPRAWVAPDYDSLCRLLRRAVEEPVEVHARDREFALEHYNHPAAGERLMGILDATLLSGKDK